MSGICWSIVLLCAMRTLCHTGIGIMYSRRIVFRFGTRSRYNFRGVEWHQNRYVNRTLICVYINSTHNRLLNRQVPACDANPPLVEQQDAYLTYGKREKFI